MANTWTRGAGTPTWETGGNWGAGHMPTNIEDVEIDLSLGSITNPAVPITVATRTITNIPASSVNLANLSCAGASSIAADDANTDDATITLGNSAGVETLNSGSSGFNLNVTFATVSGTWSVGDAHVVVSGVINGTVTQDTGVVHVNAGSGTLIASNNDAGDPIVASAFTGEFQVLGVAIDGGSSETLHCTARIKDGGAFIDASVTWGNSAHYIIDNSTSTIDVPFNIASFSGLNNPIIAGGEIDKAWNVTGDCAIRGGTVYGDILATGSVTISGGDVEPSQIQCLGFTLNSDDADVTLACNVWAASDVDVSKTTHAVHLNDAYFTALTSGTSLTFNPAGITGTWSHGFVHTDPAPSDVVNGATFGLNGNQFTGTAIAGDYPAVSLVEEDVLYALGTMSGTRRTPATTDVKNGVHYGPGLTGLTGSYVGGGGGTTVIVGGGFSF